MSPCPVHTIKTPAPISKEAIAKCEMVDDNLVSLCFCSTAFTVSVRSILAAFTIQEITAQPRATAIRVIHSASSTVEADTILFQNIQDLFSTIEYVSKII